MQNREFGAYRLAHLIAAGTTATLYTVQDRPGIVVKALPDILTEDASFKNRFEMELEALVQLEHRHLLRLYDYGIEATTPYLVMPRLQASLETRLQAQAPLSPEATFTILVGIADALDYLHQQGFVHGDVKPSNILLDENDNAYLADLGVMGLMRETYTLLGVEMPLGTAVYRAPEHWREANAGAAADIYALGVVAFQCLTGQLPYSANTVEDYKTAITQNAPQRPTRLNPNLSAAIDEVFLTVLAKQPNRRFEAASAMITALKAVFAPAATSDAPAATTVATIPRAKMTPFKLLRRMGCGAMLAVWFALMLSPCVIVTVLVEGEFVVKLSDKPNHNLRMFNVDTDDRRGFGFSYGEVERETDEELCVITHVRYIMWRGENSPVDYCQCYARSGDVWLGGPVLDEACEVVREVSLLSLKPAHYYRIRPTSE